MKYILGIDPGQYKSAYVLLRFYESDNTFEILNKDWKSNESILNIISGKKMIYCYTGIELEIAIETIVSYGMEIGQSTIDTSIWAGRFYQKAKNLNYSSCNFITRKEEKSILCRDSKAKQKNIIQALKNRFGDYGIKKNPGRLYKLKGGPKESSDHIWSAFAVGITYLDKTYGETI